jgi:putative flippase GtrA
MDLRSLITKFLKFGIVGASGMVVDFGVLYLMRDIVGLPDLWANTISFTCAATSNYFLNRLWTFRSKEKQVGVEYLKFLLVSVIGLGINNGVLLLSHLLWPAAYESGTFCLASICIDDFYLFKLLAIAITTLWNFFGNMLFTFRKR